MSLLLHLTGVVLVVGWPALFERQPVALPVPDQQATVEVLMGNAAEQTGTEAAPPSPAAAEPSPPQPSPPDTSPLPAPLPPQVVTPPPSPAPPAWQSTTLLGDGAMGASEIFGDQLKPAVGERGNAPPGYPAMSAQLGEQGVVVVRMRIGPDGQVTDVQVVQTSGYDRLDAAARAALGRWHFTPAVQDGEAVESFQDLPIRFRLY